jgi:hypothetical protein
MPDTQPTIPTPSAMERILLQLSTTTILLIGDFLLNGGTYGMSLEAGAEVKKVTLRHLTQPSNWQNGYARTWQMLKFGFYPVFLFEVVCAETGKALGTAAFSHYSDFVMPGLVGVLIAPSMSFSALNQLHDKKFHADFLHILKTEGVRGITRRSAGGTLLGLREALSYKALHHDTSAWEKSLVTHTEKYSLFSFLFRGKDGNPTPVAKGFVSIFDLGLIMAGQPLTTLAINAAIYKNRQTYSANSLTPREYGVSRINFWRGTWQLIVDKSGSKPWQGLFAGSSLRFASLAGMLGIFKYGSAPVESFVQRHLPFTKSSIGNKPA